MSSDSISNASIAMASANPKGFAKKKRANRSAKLKQCKLDARREQWLSQVKNKVGFKEDVNGNGNGGTRGGSSMQLEKEKGQAIDNLKINPKGDDEIYGDRSAIHNSSDCEFSPSNSPTSSFLGSGDSGVNFSQSSRSNSSSSTRSCSSSTNCFCSESVSEEEDEADAGDDNCLDDWEAMADALAATDKKQTEHIPNLGFVSPPSGVTNHPFSESGGTATTEQIAPVNFRAWRSDDSFRPQSLPNLSKQYSLPLNLERGSVKNVGFVTSSSCPICFEDLDCTDQRFLPCSCGFMLCLFCHKRILEEDGRCPGCRKKYEFDPVEGEATLDGGRLTVRLARSCSMRTKS